MVVLDIDGVICDFYHGFFEWIGIEPPYNEDYNCPIIGSHFHKVKDDGAFWMSLPPMDYPDFRVDLYLTARPIMSVITKRWLDIYKFPEAPVITVQSYKDKLTLLELINAQVIIEDHPETVLALKNSTCKPILYDHWYNRGVDATRIKNLSEWKHY